MNSLVETACMTCGKKLMGYASQKKRFCSRSCSAIAGARKKIETRESRFWSKVDKSGVCWIWKGSRLPNGYGRFGKRLAHRMAWELQHGPIPDGQQVLHDCPDGDNRACVRHLFLGTQQDNMTDMMRKGRNNPARGEQAGNAKLTSADVVEICRLYREEGWHQRAISKRFGVTMNTVWRLVNDKSWKHLTRS